MRRHVASAWRGHHGWELLATGDRWCGHTRPTKTVRLKSSFKFYPKTSRTMCLLSCGRTDAAPSQKVVNVHISLSLSRLRICILLLSPLSTRALPPSLLSPSPHRPLYMHSKPALAVEIYHPKSPTTLCTTKACGFLLPRVIQKTAGKQDKTKQNRLCVEPDYHRLPPISNEANILQSTLFHAQHKVKIGTHT